MSDLKKYRKKNSQYVVAVKVDLDLIKFAYRKWGHNQAAKKGDWLVDNDGDVYTVDGKVFARTYKQLRPGIYIKTTPVWARVATESGSVKTKEGESRYKRGDYLVYNNENGSDGYCISPGKFKEMYTPDRRQ